MLIKRLLKTDILYTAVGEPIADGMVSIDQEGIILEVGSDIQKGEAVIEYVQGAICPAFVNTHCHLELSHLKGLVAEKTGLAGFVADLQAHRAANETQIAEAISEGEQAMKEAGIIAVGDICNGSSTFNLKKESSIYFHSFLELFAFDPEKAGESIHRGKSLAQQAEESGIAHSIVPHSPYSVSRQLFDLIMMEAGSKPLSIHNQESRAENEMYERGEGALMDLLKGFGLDTTSFEVSGKSSLITYLSYFPTANPLLLVHNTYTSKEDILTAEKSHPNLYWCFCPRANLYIENGLPDIPSFVDAGVKCTLGTDSLASNHGLSIWDEIKCIQAKFPSIPLHTLIQWGSINGAQLLGIDEDYGSIESGKKAVLNQLINDEVMPLTFPES